MFQTSSSVSNSVSDEDDALFYLESDHLALKGNQDYSELLKTLVLLEAQRSKAIEDYEKILELQTEAVSNPNLFYKKVMDDEDWGLPDLQVIVELPNIDWSKYPTELPAKVLQFLNSEPAEEKLKPGSVQVQVESPKKLETTFKQTWSVDEQRKLEELLQIYPPEPFEIRRYKKIAAALGNRTVKQVSSRVQKYFLKLYKAGLPIPGRVPKNAEKVKKSKLHAHQRHNHLLLKPTTFFPQLDIPVVMNEEEVIPGPNIEGTAVPNNGNSDNYLLPITLEIPKQSPLNDTKRDADLQIELLKKVKLEKEKEYNSEYSQIQHLGYKCNYCDEEPIYGIRWHCETCTTESIDFCTDCVIGQMYSAEPHPFTHQLQTYSEAQQINGNSSYESESDEAGDSNDSSISSKSTDETNDEDGDDDDDMECGEDSNGTSNLNDYCEDEDSIDIDEKSNVLHYYYNRNSETASSTTDKTMNYINVKTEPNVRSVPKLSPHSDSNIDEQNVSYNYLHSNLLLDEN